MKLLDELVMHAPADDLIQALAKRGATTRPLANGLKIVLKLKAPAEPKRRTRGRTTVARYANDPRVKLR